LSGLDTKSGGGVLSPNWEPCTLAVFREGVMQNIAAFVSCALLGGVCTLGIQERLPVSGAAGVETHEHPDASDPGTEQSEVDHHEESSELRPAIQERRSIIETTPELSSDGRTLEVRISSRTEDLAAYQVEITVTDEAGRTLASHSRTEGGAVHGLAPESTDGIAIDVTDLPQGIYAMRTAVRGGTLRELADITDMSYIRVTERGAEEVTFEEWSAESPAAEGKFVDVGLESSREERPNE